MIGDKDFRLAYSVDGDGNQMHVRCDLGAD
jgi:hypothetical protein